MTQKRTRRSFFEQPPLPVPAASPPLFERDPAPYQDAPGVPSHLDIRVTILGHTNATVAKAEMNLSGYPYTVPVATGRGSSTRHPDDEPDEEIGALKAVSRALRSLAGQMDRRANSLTRHADSVREHRMRTRGRRHVEEELVKDARDYFRRLSTVTLPRRDKPSAWEDPSFVGMAEASIAPDGSTDGVKVHLAEGQTAADVPEGVREALSHLFPDTPILYSPDGDVLPTREFMDQLDETLRHPEKFVRRDRNGRFTKREAGEEQDTSDAPGDDHGGHDGA